MADRKILLLIGLFLFFVIPQVCSEVCAPVEKDIDVLRNQKFWQFEVDKVVGCEPFYPPANGSNVSSTCVFYFSICQPVPSFCPENSGICLANKINYGPKFNNKTVYTMPKRIGGFQEGGKANFDSEWDYFKVVYDDVVDDSKLLTSTVIKFQCNHSAKWQKSEDHKVPYQPVNISATASLVGEIYWIVFDYSGACPGGGGGGGGGGDEEPSKPLSVGSIILILFFPGLFLYCVVGVLINRGSGKTGREMIPNAKFWSDLPGLIADGFSFAIAKITCSEMSTTRETYNRM